MDNKRPYAEYDAIHISHQSENSGILKARQHMKKLSPFSPFKK
jgi:hypothetical protein